LELLESLKRIGLCVYRHGTSLLVVSFLNSPSALTGRNKVIGVSEGSQNYAVFPPGASKDLSGHLLSLIFPNM